MNKKIGNIQSSHSRWALQWHPGQLWRETSWRNGYLEKSGTRKTLRERKEGCKRGLKRIRSIWAPPLQRRPFPHTSPLGPPRSQHATPAWMCLLGGSCHSQTCACSVEAWRSTHISGEHSPGRKKGPEALLSIIFSATMERPSQLPVTAM